MRGLRALAWLACVAASANGPPKRNAIAKAAAEPAGATTAREIAARNAAAEMIKSKLATQTTRPVFEQGFAGPRRIARAVHASDNLSLRRHGRRLQGASCKTYSVSGSEHQSGRHGKYVANGKCEGRTLYECVDCASADQYLWYNSELEKWYIGSGGCGETRAGVRSPASTFGDPGSVTQWTEYAGSSDGWVETSTISVVCTKTPAPTISLAPTATPVPTRTPWAADDESIRTAVALWFSDRAAAEATYGHISTWQTGQVTDMSELFCAGPWKACNRAASSFNEDIGAWDTSGVTTMFRMFYAAAAFNQPIGSWSTGAVKTMRWMFSDATSFNQPLGGWRVDQVININMHGMFYDAEKFDQDLGWCVRDDANINIAFRQAKCEALSCGVVQGGCSDPEAATDDYCKLSDPKLCTGSRYAFVEAQDNPLANIENRYAVPIFADVDGDGKNDLLIGQEDGTLALYRNLGSEFQLAVNDEEDPFKSVAVGGRAAPALVDLDGDGLLDLVVGAQCGGLAFYKNTGTATAPVFTKVSDAVTSNNLKPVNAAECPASRDALQDLPHCDFAACGDLCEGDGECGTSDSLDNCGITNFNGNEICEGRWPNQHRCDVYRKTCDARPGPFGSVTLAMTHTAPAFADLDGDGLVDLVIGKESAGALAYYKNVGSSTTARFQVVSKGPFAGLTLGRFSKPTFYDIDNDGDQDLIVGDNFGDVLLFVNVGSRFASSFSVVEDVLARTIRTYAAPTFGALNGVPSLVVGNSASRQLVVYGETLKVEFARTKISPFAGIDIGDNSDPIFADLDGDGDLDLVAGRYDNELTFFRNVGTASQPDFEESTFFGMIINPDEVIAPTIADLNNDGLLDLVVGEYSGRLSYYRNVGTPSQPNFELVAKDCSDQAIYLDDDPIPSVPCTEGVDPFDGIEESLGKFSKPKPTLADLNGDGLLDLVVGERDGSLHYWRNDGTPSQPIFQEVDKNSPFEGIDVNADEGDGYSTPTFVDLDNDGDLDLVVGSGGESAWDNDNGGKIFYWRNVGTQSQPRFQKVDEGSPFDGIDVGDYSDPTFADIDNDGDLDFVVGTYDGRLRYFENTESCRKTGEDGACSSNGVCGTLVDGEATCECVAPWGGSQCGICAAGTYKDEDGDCQPCKSGMVCDEPGVTLENVRLEKNRWRTSPESTKIETCPLKNSCESGDDISVPATGEDLCKKGHEGPLCAVCKRHYYRLGQECVKCRRSTIAFTVIGILVGIVIFLAFFLMAMSYSNVVAKGVNKSFEKSQESEISPTRMSRQGSTYFARADSAVQTADRPDPTDAGSGFKGWLEGEAAEALRRNVTTFVKQLSGTYSIFVNLPWVFDIKFPNVYERVLERLGLINVDMSFSLECVISRKVTFQDRLLAATIGPMVAILLVIVSVEINWGSDATVALMA